MVGERRRTAHLCKIILKNSTSLSAKGWITDNDFIIEDEFLSELWLMIQSHNKGINLKTFDNELTSLYYLFKYPY